MRCGRCGNENGESNRFCGMCGATLVATAEAAGQARAPASTTTGPVITGPSFLGLNKPGFQVDRPAVPHAAAPHADAARDPLRPSSNLDYLLDDEEEPKRGSGKLILVVVVALALAVGFGYLRWRQGGFDWLNAGDKKPTAAMKPTPDTAQTGADSGGTPAAAPDGGVAQIGAGATGTAPATNGAASGPAESGAPQAGAAQNTAQVPAAQNASAQTLPTQTSPSQTAPSPAEAADPNLPAGSASQAAGSNSGAPSAPAELPAAPKAKMRKTAVPKPAAAKPVDSVTEAERFIYGRGVKQDCDRGLRMLKPAAERSNAKAMISMGAMYSTGTCTPRDLPTAYRWFALALHKDPDNQALQDDLQKLWGQMTQPERQLAIKLSQ